MKKGASLLLLIIMILTPGILWSQEDDLTVEEFYLQNIEMQIIREQAVDQDRDMKLLALKNIEEMVDEGKVGEGDKEVHYLLELLANEGIGHEVRENGVIVNNYPIVRKEACTLLGEVGGEESKDTLIQITMKDSEPMVLSEAVYALGRLGYNESNEVSQSIANVVFSQDAIMPNDNLAFAALLSFEKLADTNAGLTDPYAVQAIIAIAKGNYIRPVKMKANELLNKLRDY